MSPQKHIRNILHDLVFGLAPTPLKKRLMSCEEITFIMANDTKLSTSKKIWFNCHYFLCSCCESYYKQFKIIENQSKDLFNQDLDTDAKSRVVESKSDALKKFQSK